MTARSVSDIASLATATSPTGSPATRSTELKVHCTWWRDRKGAVLERGGKGVAIGYGGRLAEVASGYSFVGEPLTRDFDKKAY